MSTSSQRYKDNVLNLCDLTKEIIVDIQSKGIKTKLQPALIDVGIMILENTSAEQMVEKFISSSHDYCVEYKIENNDPHPYIWEKIRHKEEKFLLENINTILGEMSEDMLQSFTELFVLKDKKNKSVINPKHKEEMWKLIHGMVCITIRYIHEKRKPGDIEKEVDGKIVKSRGYTVAFYSDIKIKSLAQKWELNI